MPIDAIEMLVYICLQISIGRYIYIFLNPKSIRNPKLYDNFETQTLDPQYNFHANGAISSRSTKPLPSAGAEALAIRILKEGTINLCRNVLALVQAAQLK